MNPIPFRKISVEVTGIEPVASQLCHWGDEAVIALKYMLLNNTETAKIKQGGELSFSDTLKPALNILNNM